MMNWYWKCCAIALAGGLGSLARYGLSEWLETWFGRAFYLGTLVVNLLGCLLFGIVWATGTRGIISMELRVILLVGFLGGFTTFSSFAFHNQQLLTGRDWGALLLNVLVQNLAGIAAIALGIKLAEWVFPVGVIPAR